MAIQVRRGDYADFDASKLVAGEPAMVLTNDPDTSDGTAVYFGAGDGSARRVMYADEFGDGSVTTPKLATGAVTLAKLDSTLAASIPMSPLTNAEIDAITQ